MHFIFIEFIGPKPKDYDLDVSDELIYTNRKSAVEIRQLPKFSNYQPGDASEVRSSFIAQYLSIAVSLKGH